MSATNGTAITANDLVERLEARYPEPQWLTFAEVRDGPGWNRRTCDFVALNAWESGAQRLVICETKVSRTDWRRELEDLNKSARFRAMAHEWWIVAPSKVVPVEELPPGWGLMESWGDKLRCARRCVPNEAATGPDPEFWVMLLRDLRQRYKDLQKEHGRFAEFAGRSIGIADLEQLANKYHRHTLEREATAILQRKQMERRAEAKAKGEWAAVERRWHEWINATFGWEFAQKNNTPDAAYRAMDSLARCVRLLRSIGEDEALQGLIAALRKAEATP